VRVEIAAVAYGSFAMTMLKYKSPRRKEDYNQQGLKKKAASLHAHNSQKVL
jgi:hypothetical protein